MPASLRALATKKTWVVVQKAPQKPAQTPAQTPVYRPVTQRTENLVFGYEEAF